MYAKVHLQQYMLEATEECVMDQLCADLSAGIDGVVRAMQTIWDQMCIDVERGLLLEDVQNNFNNINWIFMFWMVRNEYPHITHFFSGCCCHWYTLVTTRPDGVSLFIH